MTTDDRERLARLIKPGCDLHGAEANELLEAADRIIVDGWVRQEPKRTTKGIGEVLFGDVQP